MSGVDTLSAWCYGETLLGNTYVGYILEGTRLIACVRHHMTNPREPGERVLRSRRELQQIVSWQVANLPNTPGEGG